MASKYKPELCAALVKHMSGGGSFAAFAAQAEVSRKTLYEWLDIHPQFNEAKGIGEAKSLDYWESLGLGAITGQIKNFQQATYIFMMKCRFRKFGYADTNAFEDPDDSGDDELDKLPTATILKMINAKK